MPLNETTPESAGLPSRKETISSNHVCHGTSLESPRRVCDCDAAIFLPIRVAFVLKGIRQPLDNLECAHQNGLDRGLFFECVARSTHIMVVFEGLAGHSGEPSF